MCNNWKRGDRKEDMTLDQIEQAFSSDLWKNIENANISGGEPTTRNDLVDIARLMIDKFPRLRKLGVNTTGLTPHRAIPMLTKIVEICDEQRRHLQHARVDRRRRRDAQPGAAGETRLREGRPDHPGHAGAAEDAYRFNFGISTTIFSTNLDDAENILSWAKKEKLDIVFNMVRFTEPMLGNADLADTCTPLGADEERMRQFFLDRMRQDSAARRTEPRLHALRRHDRATATTGSRPARSRRRA